MGIPKSKLQKYLDMVLKNKETIRVLEAGCGSMNQIELKQKKHITGIDISQKQLDRNINLDDKILGDLQYYNYQPEIFDLIVCWDVLEHIPNPLLVLDGFTIAIKKEGLIILKLPNVLSFKGLLTKYLPLYFHTLVYKHIYKSKRIYEVDGGPFKTYLRFSIAPNALSKYFIRHNLKIVYFDFFDFGEDPDLINRSKLLLIYKVLKAFIYYLSFGKLGDNEFIMVLQK